MIPYFNKNTFYYENYCSYGSWQISVIDSGRCAEKHRGNTATRYGRGEIIAISVAPRVLGFDYHPFAGKSIYEKRTDKITMAEKMKCEYCEKDAIGYQGFGCCSAYVCLNHADNFVLALKPGEKLSSGECYFERFTITD